MWARLRAEAGSGVGVPIGKPKQLAQRIAELARSAELDAASRRARAFVLRHAFDDEFALRIADIRKHLGTRAVDPAVVPAVPA